MACPKQTEPIGFASMVTIGEGAMAQDKKHHSKGKGKKGAGVAVVSVVPDVQPYIPVELL